MARRNNLCRPRRALPVPAGPGVKPGRLLPRRVARQWTPRRLGGVAGLHLALGSDHVCFRARRGTFHRPGRGGLFAWAETRRGRRGRPSRVGHDEKPDAGSAACRNRPGGRCDRRRVRRLLCSSCRDCAWRLRRASLLSERGCDGLGTSEFSGHATEWRRRAFSVRGVVTAVACCDGGDAIACARFVRRLLPLRRAGVWRRPCRAAAAAGRGRDTRLGEQRSIPRRLWPGPGGARDRSSRSPPISAPS